MHCSACYLIFGCYLDVVISDGFEGQKREVRVEFNHWCSEVDEEESPGDDHLAEKWTNSEVWNIKHGGVV